MMRNLLGLLLLCCTVSTFAVAEERPLMVSAIPDEAPTELIRKFQPLGAYLESKIGRKVKFVPVTDYAATVEGLAAGKLDMVWYGGFTFVQARVRTGNAIALVQREEDTQFHSKIVVPASSKAQKVEDLKGGTFVFGAPSSTSGHLMPRYFLMQKGIDPAKDFRRISFSGAHDATARLVQAGKVDGGALNESVYDKLLAEKKIDPTKLRVLWTTPAYYDYTWTVRGDLDPQTVKQLRDAFLELDASEPEQRAILDLQRTRKYVASSAESYKQVEEAARAAGLLK